MLLQARATPQDGESATLAHAPVHLAHVRLPGATHATAHALSCCDFLAASTPHATYLATLATPTPPTPLTSDDADAAAPRHNGDNDEPSIDLIPLPSGVPPAQALEFSAGGSELFVGAADGRLVRVDLGPDAEEDDRVSVVHTFDVTQRGVFASVRMPASTLPGSV